MVRPTVALVLLASITLASEGLNLPGHGNGHRKALFKFQPQITGHSPQNITVSEGDTFQLDCEVSDIGSYVFYWRRGTVIDLFLNDIRVDQDDESKKYFLNGTSLVVPNTTQADRGLFQCFFHTNPPQNVNFLVTVKRSIVRIPDVDNLQLNESQNYTLRCEDMKHERKLSWYYDDTRHFMSRLRLMQAGGDLHLVNVSSDIDGSYICSPDDVLPGFGPEIAVTVLMKPKVILNHSVRMVADGSVFTVPCALNESHVDASLFWTFKGQIISEGTGKKSAHLEQYGQRLVNHLIFDPFRREDNGIYSCVASNSAGRSEKTIKIEAIDDPDMSKHHTLFTPLSIVLSVSVTCTMIATAVAVKVVRKARRLDPELQRLTEALVACNDGPIDELITEHIDEPIDESSYEPIDAPIVHLQPDFDVNYFDVAVGYGSTSSITTGDYATVDYTE